MPIATRRPASSAAGESHAREDTPSVHRAAERDRWLRFYPIALGLGGLGGAWRTAIGFGAPTWPAAGLVTACFVVWLSVTAMYVKHGGAHPLAAVTDLRHPDQGFATGYIPVIPLLLLAQLPVHAPAVRILDLVLFAGWALATAAMVAHWLTSPRDRHAIHPGFSLPVVGGPFISCISLQANGWHMLAQGVFALGVFFWLTFGTVIVNRLMTEEGLSDARFPTLAALMVPPATASIAWFGMNDNRITTVGIGLAMILAMMTLVQVFIVPEYLRRPFVLSAWTFCFPVAATANTVGRWVVAAPSAAGHALAWSVVVAATALFGVLATFTARLMWRTRRALTSR